MKKRVLSIILALLLVLAVMPTAWAAAPTGKPETIPVKTDEMDSTVLECEDLLSALPIHGDEPNVNTSIIGKLRSYILNNGSIYNDDSNRLQVHTTLYLDSAELYITFVLHINEDLVDMFCIIDDGSSTTTLGSITLDISTPSAPTLDDTFSYLTTGKTDSGTSYTVLGIANNFYMSSYTTNTSLTFHGIYKIGSGSTYNFSNNTTYNSLGTSVAKVSMASWAIFLRDITNNGTMNDLGFSSFDDPSKPVLISSPKSVAVAVGETAKFTANVTGGNLRYQWQYRTSSSGSWKNSTTDSATSATLKVTGSATRHGYQYRCIVKNSAGSVTTKAATLTIKPKISTQPSDKNQTVGSTAKFTIKASGADLKYQWQYKTPTGSSWNTCSMSGNKTATLSVPVTAARNGYQYRCVITDANGTRVYSNAAKLTVKTKITSQPESVSAEVNTSVKFTVKATGAGLKYQWQYRTLNDSTWTNTSITGNKTSTLTVKATAARDGFEFRCKITDANGKVTYSDAATLLVV